MADEIYTRGQTIHFSATFKDASGAAFTPTAPKLVLSYLVATTGHVRQTKSIDLTADGSEWVADWNSREAPIGGTVYWSVYATSPEPKVAKDGSFRLHCNDANVSVAS